jgi:hypothetical protein
MYDFSLYGDIYLRKLSDKRETEPIPNLFSFSQSLFELNKFNAVTIFENKLFVEKQYSSLFNRSYCLLYIERLSVSKSSVDTYTIETTHLPRLKDHSRAVRIGITFNDREIIQSTISTVRGEDSDIWYFLIQLADFSVMAKFKHQAGIPV